MNNDFEVAKSILHQTGELTGVTSGNSMRPLFRDGKDRAVIAPLPERLKVNDVLLYRKAATDEVILHRVVKIKNGCPVLRGDGLFFTETDIKKTDIIGIMKGFYRNGRYYECGKSKAYKIYVFCLRAAYPLRRLLHKAVSFIRIIKRKFKKTR